MIAVYAAGAISSPNYETFWENIRNGLAITDEIIDAGMAPFPTFCDFVYSLRRKVPVEQYYKMSMEFLRRCDAVLVSKERMNQSHGTQAEIKEAQRLNIPVFYDIEDSKRWARGALAAKTVWE